MKSVISRIKRLWNPKRRTAGITNKQRIVLYLHQLAPLDISWVVLTNESRIQETVLHGDITVLAAMAAPYEIDVIIPGEDVLLANAELPKLNSERLLQAIPYAIEDKLIDELSDLHFAIGKQTSHGTPVAVINKIKMSAYLEILKQYGLTINTMVPSTLAQPYIENNWFISRDNHTSIIRTAAFQGFVSDNHHIESFLEIALLETIKKPECIHVENIGTNLAALKLQDTNITINEITSTELHHLEKTAVLLGTQPYINLLQGDYRPKRTTLQTKKIWIAAGAIAAAWLLLSIGTNLVSFFILHNAKKTSDRAISQIYFQQFPHATTVVAPRQRMESALKQASGAANKNVFLAITAYFSDALQKTPEVRLVNLTYQDEHLTANVVAASFAMLDTLTHALQQEGLSVKQQNATMSDSEVKATLFIGKGAI